MLSKIIKNNNKKIFNVNRNDNNQVFKYRLADQVSNQINNQFYNHINQNPNLIGNQPSIQNNIQFQNKQNAILTNQRRRYSQPFDNNFHNINHQKVSNQINNPLYYHINQNPNPIGNQALIQNNIQFQNKQNAILPDQIQEVPQMINKNYDPLIKKQFRQHLRPVTPQLIHLFYLYINNVKFIHLK